MKTASGSQVELACSWPLIPFLFGYICLTGARLSQLRRFVACTTLKSQGRWNSFHDLSPRCQTHSRGHGAARPHSCTSLSICLTLIKPFSTLTLSSLQIGANPIMTSAAMPEHAQYEEP